MADWLIHFLLQIGGTAALLAVAGLWLWRKIDKALESYTTAYANGQAAIDVRIRNLEKLAEEQARLTRTVEGIKDEIAAERKSRDNRWEFRRRVYENIITSVADLIIVLNAGLIFMESHKDAQITPAIQKDLDNLTGKISEAGSTFSRNASLSPLATADGVNRSLLQHVTAFQALFGASKDRQTVRGFLETFTSLLPLLQAEGRKELWGDSEPRAEAAAQNEVEANCGAAFEESGSARIPPGNSAETQ